MNGSGLRHGLAAGLLFISGAALAVDPMEMKVDGKEQGWKGDIELGYVKTSGNTDTTAAILKLAIRGGYTDWVHEFISRGYHATDTGNTTAANLMAQWRSNYVLRREIDYLFGLVRYDNDRFAGYKLRMTEVGGYGYKIIKQENFRWAAEAGVGGQQTTRTDGEQNNEGIVRLGTWLDWNISKTSIFTYNLFTEIGSSNTYTESDAELSVKINEAWSVVLGWLVKNNSEVQPGVEKTDMTTTVTIKYAFLN